MFLILLSTYTTIFFIGMFGILVNRQNILVVFMCIEVMLLGVNLNFILISVHLDDLYGQIFSLFILTVAAAESAVGLAILITYNTSRGNIFITKKINIKG
jgi:NADH-quinone oxidoreductase subunit K